jgi:hypothetical protein
MMFHRMMALAAAVCGSLLMAQNQNVQRHPYNFKRGLAD